MILKQCLGTLLFLLAFLCPDVIQSQSSTEFICDFNPNEFAVPHSGGLCNENGLSHTPDGTLRLLVVFAGFEGFQGQIGPDIPTQPSMNNWDNEITPLFELPNFVEFNEATLETTMDDFMFTNEDILQPDVINPSKNLSNILYLMSQPNREFNVVGSVFSDPSGQPRQVVIPTNGLGSWQAANRRVAERMVEIWETETENPNPQQAVDDYFSQFDQRENFPSYAFNNVNSAPDGIIDMVVYIYRYKNSWGDQPIEDMDEDWNGSGGGFYSENVITPTTPIGGFGFQNGFLGATGDKDLRYLFLHEFAHSLFLAPHNCGANGVAGDHFPVGHTGIGAASINVPIFNPMMAAWERWYLGYTTPFEPIDTEGSFTYNLSDYVTSGGAIRVPLPFPIVVDPNTGDIIDRQYLWIENHAKVHPLDENVHAGKNINPNNSNDPEHIVTDNDAGIYMYVEDMAEDCTFLGGVFNRGGSMQMINPMGNWDLFHNTTIPATENGWDAVMHPFEYLVENPIAGSNPWFKHREDLDGNNTEIGYNGDHNSPGGDNESTVIYRELLDDGAFHHTYRAYGVKGGASNSTAFQIGDELSMGTNPTIINYPRYNATLQEVEPYFLNGIKVEITSSGNPATVKITYKHTAVEDDVRWTGNIILPDITESIDPDLVLAKNKQITLDISGTAHRETMHPTTNRHANPTSLTIASGAKLHLLDNSRILVKEHATLVIEDGAEVLLEDKACIVVEPGGTLHYRGEDITLNGPDAVIILKGTLRTDDDIDFTFKGMGYVDIHSTHVLELGVGSNFDIDRLNLPGQGTRFL